MPPACRPWVPTRVMKWSERRSIWRNSFRLSGSTVISGHHAPSPSSKSSLARDKWKRKEEKLSDEQWVDVHRRIYCRKGEGVWEKKNEDRMVKGKVRRK